MAGSAIVARLQLDSKDYDKKLEQAKRKTRDFSQSGGAGIGEMMGKFQALAGAVAACKAAQEVFNATIQSSQTIGDAYTVVVSQCKGAVDEFVYAMANADFSGFNDGLKGIFQNAKDAAQAMDALGNAQISFDYLTAGYKSDFKTNMGTAKDKSKSLTERQAAYDAALGDLDKIGEAVKVYTDKTIAAVVSNAKAKGNNINKDFITRENIDRVFALDISAGGDEEKARLAERYKTFEDLKKREQKLEKAVERARLNGYASEAQYAQQLADVRAQINSDDMQMAALYNAMLVKGTDEWLKGLADLVVKADNANTQYQELKTSSLEVANALGVAAQNAAKLSAEARDADNALKAEADRTRNFEGKGLTMAGLPAGTSAGPLATSITPMETAIPQEAIDNVERYNAALETLESTYVSTADGLGMVGNMIGQLGGMMDEGTAAWMNYAGNIVSAIGGALPALENLSAAQAAAAVAGTALNPWTAVAAVAAIGSVVAAMSQLPKFATGGVVPGNMMNGDNVLIRANSGEVVLTKAQANNIGSMLNAGMNGKVVFEIRGDKLVGILNNYNKTKAYGVR